MMTMLVYGPTGDDGPGPITVDPEPGSTIVHGAYGAAELARTPHARIAGHVHLTLTWSEAVPYVVTATFTHAGKSTPKQWRIGRFLLRNHGGTGDVQVREHGDVTWLHLHTPIAQGAVALDTTWLSEFVTATDDVVHAGNEWQDSVPDTVHALHQLFQN